MLTLCIRPKTVSVHTTCWLTTARPERLHTIASLSASSPELANIVLCRALRNRARQCHSSSSRSTLTFLYLLHNCGSSHSNSLLEYKYVLASTDPHRKYDFQLQMIYQVKRTPNRRCHLRILCHAQVSVRACNQLPPCRLPKSSRVIDPVGDLRGTLAILHNLPRISPAAFGR